MLVSCAYGYVHDKGQLHSERPPKDRDMVPQLRTGLKLDGDPCVLVFSGKWSRVSRPRFYVVVNAWHK